MDLIFPVGADVMAHDIRATLGRFTMTPATVLSHVTGPGKVPGYTVAFPSGHRRYVTAGQVIKAPIEPMADSHLYAVALRARSRSATMSPRLCLLLSKARAAGERFRDAHHTTNTLELLLRRRMLGDAAFRMAAAVEAALDVTGDQRLVDHLEAFNEIGVDHHASSRALSREAGALIRHTRAIAHMADRRPRIAAAMSDQVKKNLN